MAVGGEFVSIIEEVLNPRPPIHELIEHVRIDAYWYKFGVLLKLDTSKLEAIRVMNEDCSFKATKMFELWLDTNPNATRKDIIETLRKPAIGMNTIAEEYERILTVDCNNVYKISRRDEAHELNAVSDELQLMKEKSKQQEAEINKLKSTLKNKEGIYIDFNVICMYKV